MQELQKFQRGDDGIGMFVQRVFKTFRRVWRLWVAASMESVVPWKSIPPASSRSAPDRPGSDNRAAAIFVLLPRRSAGWDGRSGD